MLDCEFVNRFLAFYLLGIEQYAGNLEYFLNDVLIRLQKESKETLEMCRRDFLKAMRYARSIFDETAFRKINSNGIFGRINKPLYDAVSVSLARLSLGDCEKLLENKNELNRKYIALLKNKAFVDIITNGTAKTQNVEKRYLEINNIFQEVLVND